MPFSHEKIPEMAWARRVDGTRDSSYFGRRREDKARTRLPQTINSNARRPRRFSHRQTLAPSSLSRGGPTCTSNPSKKRIVLGRTDAQGQVRSCLPGDGCRPSAGVRPSGMCAVLRNGSEETPELTAGRGGPLAPSGSGSIPQLLATLLLRLDPVLPCLGPPPAQAGRARGRPTGAPRGPPG